MAKKKKVDPNRDLDDDFGDFEDEDIESVYPEIEKKSSKTEEISKKTVEKIDKVSKGDFEEEFEEDLELEIEEKPEFHDYKHLNLKLNKGSIESDYELEIIGQSHGFCNIFINHLLNLEGVDIAAYKVTGIEPSKIYIRLKNGYKIKEILYKAIESLREKVIEVQKIFQNLE